jgi:hypothetical protein
MKIMGRFKNPIKTTATQWNKEKRIRENCIEHEWNDWHV